MRGEGFSMKRILSIQDISCLGRCSQTIALPVLSSMGVEVTVLPTAVLSTHTGFPNPSVRDLSDLIVPAAEHWQREGVQFDAIYTGYLGSAEVADAVQEAIRLLRGADTRMFVDPVMGDHGRLYARLDEDYVRLSAAFCGQADVIVPNLTEACLLTGTAYREEWTEAELRELLRPEERRNVFCLSEPENSGGISRDRGSLRQCGARRADARAAGQEGVSDGGGLHGVDDCTDGQGWDGGAVRREF